MTSLASYLASLAGAAPQEGQKATPANGTGASGIFAALLETTSADGEATTEIPNPADPTTLLPSTPNTGDAADQAQIAGGQALSEALTNGFNADGTNGDVEAAIVEGPLAADVVEALSGEDTSSALIGVPAGNGNPEGGVSEGSSGHNPAGLAAPTAATPISHAVPADQSAAPRNGGPGNAPERLLHRHAASNGGSDNTPARPTGLDNAVSKASENGREHGLTRALERSGQPADADSTRLSQTTADGEADIDAINERPVQTKGDAALPEPGRGRTHAVPQPPQVIQRLIKTDGGQTLINVQERIGGELSSISSPPTLTVSVQAPAASPGPASPPAPHVPVGALAVHIAHQANNGARRFEIRLDPPELGRIDVRLDVSREGQVMTHLVVERAETLDLLLRDAKQLEKALQDAGLDMSEKGMKFSLKDQGFAGDDPEFFDDDANAHAGADDSDDDAARSEMPPPHRYLASTGLDIRI